MKRNGSISAPRFVGPTMALALVLAATSLAQQQGGYAITEDTFNSPSAAAEAGPNSGPVRLARFSLVEGKVTWRPNSETEWSEGSINLPLQQGGQVWVDRGGRAEIQFDDGSVIRLAGGAIITLQTMTSDANGEFTAIKLSQGLAYMRLRSRVSEYEIDTPLSSARAFGPAKVRLGASESTEIGVREGEVRVEGSRGSVTLHRDDYVAVNDHSDGLDVRPLPREDRWDNFNDEQDNILDHPSANLPANVALVAGDLDNYGEWRNDEEYGNVWCPRGVDTSWQPYRDGRWVWVASFGWTWCGSERWGWAPYHYGSWVRRTYGWAWCPGPVNQYWCPAVVHFTEYDGNIAWCPLSPRDIRYPSSLFVGFGGGSWWANFSIGGCAYYEPRDRWCEPRPWANNWVNHYGWHAPRPGEHLQWDNHPLDRPHTNHFVPSNAGSGWGVVQASHDEFTHGGNFSKPHQPGGWAFEHGQDRPGGWGVKPSPVSITPGRKFPKDSAPDNNALTRPIYHPTTPRDNPGSGWGTRPTKPEGGSTTWGGGKDLGGGNVRPSGGFDHPRPNDPPQPKPADTRPNGGWDRPKPNEPISPAPAETRPNGGGWDRPRPNDPIQPRPSDKNPMSGWGTRPDRTPGSGRVDRAPRNDPGKSSGGRGWGGSSRQGGNSGGGKKDKKGGGW